MYTTDEMVTALNASIEEQGAVANTITTSIAYIDGHFLIRCVGQIDEHPYGIEILPDATAAESLGFEQNQMAGVFGPYEHPYDVFDGNLDLVAANTPL